jgi:D-aminopeptidase
VLVQSNFGGVLEIMGAPVGRELGRYIFRDDVESRGGERRPDGSGGGDVGPAGSAEASPIGPDPQDPGDGSIMIVVATDAPLSARNLERLAARAIHGLARTGSPSTNGSGDYVIAFSTAEGVRRGAGERTPRSIADLPNDGMSPLFQAVVEATEESIYNSLFRAVTVRGHRGTVEALPIDRVREILRRHGVVRQEGAR